MNIVEGPDGRPVAAKATADGFMRVVVESGGGGGGDASAANQVLGLTALDSIYDALQLLGTEATSADILAAIQGLGDGATLADLATALLPLASAATEATQQDVLAALEAQGIDVALVQTNVALLVPDLDAVAHHEMLRRERLSRSFLAKEAHGLRHLKRDDNGLPVDTRQADVVWNSEHVDRHTEHFARLAGLTGDLCGLVIRGDCLDHLALSRAEHEVSAEQVADAAIDCETMRSPVSIVETHLVTSTFLDATAGKPNRQNIKNSGAATMTATSIKNAIANTYATRSPTHPRACFIVRRAGARPKDPSPLPRHEDAR